MHQHFALFGGKYTKRTNIWPRNARNVNQSNTIAGTYVNLQNYSLIQDLHELLMHLDFPDS